jgi:hypothetical protein
MESCLHAVADFRKDYAMRKDALWGWYVLAGALVWLSLIPGRVAAN